jgi:hypothetical protein
MSDYNFLMESRLSPEQFAVLTLISRLSAEHGQRLYLVGGAVRDLTYGQQVVRDLDFIVEGAPQHILRALPSADSAKAGRGAREPIAEPPLALEYQNLDEHLNSAELSFPMACAPSWPCAGRKSTPAPDSGRRFAPPWSSRT